MTTSLDEVRDGVRQQLLATLMQKVREDHYPSWTMLDLVEELLGPEEVATYVDLLMEKVEADEFPSLNLIRRVRDLC